MRHTALTSTTHPLPANAMVRVEAISALLLSAKSKLLARIIAAIFGAYAFAAASCALLALILPLPKAQSTLTAMMLSFLLYALGAIWVFSVHKTRTAWCGLILSTAVLSSLTYLLGQ